MVCARVIYGVRTLVQFTLNTKYVLFAVRVREARYWPAILATVELWNLLWSPVATQCQESPATSIRLRKYRTGMASGNHFPAVQTTSPWYGRLG